jgi:hypothetical protein
MPLLSLWFVLSSGLQMFVSLPICGSFLCFLYLCQGKGLAPSSDISAGIGRIDWGESFCCSSSCKFSVAHTTDAMRISYQLSFQPGWVSWYPPMSLWQTPPDVKWVNKLKKMYQTKYWLGYCIIMEDIK